MYGTVRLLPYWVGNYLTNYLTIQVFIHILDLDIRGFDSLTTDQIIFARVAQLVEAAVLEAVQCGFESHLAHQKLW